MILHPGIIALLVLSCISSFMVLAAAFHGVRILRFWDLHSGSERQLRLERSTYLISTLLAYAMAFQLLGLFLFIDTVDRLAPLFIGAMCAVGSLAVNSFGYPSLLLKIFIALMCGVWLILNRADNRAPDYPLIRPKYLLLLSIAPIQVVDTLLQAFYFFRLRPDVITSCCGSLFSMGEGNLPSEISWLPPGPVLGVYAAVVLALLTTATVYLKKGKGSVLLGILTFLHLVIALGATISALSPYVYELPHHHCPFCILHGEYGRIGYIIYPLLLTGTVTGMGTSILHRWRKVPSLEGVVHCLTRSLATVCVASVLSVAATTVVSIQASHLKLL